MEINEVNEKNIWNYNQSKPSLIIEDFKELGISEKISAQILMARGVFKWFTVRRKLIKLKNTWKDRINNTLGLIRYFKVCPGSSSKKLHYLRGYLKAYEECRKEVRKLCHSERWTYPDFDKKAMYFLENKNE